MWEKEKIGLRLYQNINIGLCLWLTYFLSDLIAAKLLMIYCIKYWKEIVKICMRNVR